MKTYYIFRHGQTFASKKNGGYGLRRLTAGILEEGKPSIQRMGEFLKTVPTDYNVSSPLHRCRQTTKIITLETGKQFRIDLRLNEYLLEPFQFFRRRVKSFIHSMERSDHEQILICTHGAVIAALMALLTKGHFEVMDMQGYPKPGVLIKIERHRLESFDFNKD